ncbi:serine/arginine-rich splicing factor 7-like isoform X2 [Watersipora subatra]|uniref:serine/arginine-rich splicing factor 7-like isoform X2 n=1 Tax=Watersipora subatra TaxID=2589382 RepID=UPI00355BF95D
MSHDVSCKVYVGDVSLDTTEKELEREFSYYGKLKSVWVARNPAGFAFVEFEDSRDADDAIAALDGKNICGSRVRVEPSTGRRKTKPWDRDGGRGYGRDSYGGGRGGPPSRHDSRRPPSKPFDPNDECYKCGERGHYAYDCGGGGSSGGRSCENDHHTSFLNRTWLPT